MTLKIDVDKIVELQDFKTEQWHRVNSNTREDDILLHLVKLNHQHNFDLWHAEDKARVKDDKIVAQSKRQIDKFNQLRNDAIEDIDDYILEVFKDYINDDFREPSVNYMLSETPGAIIDKLSIMSLKIYHLKEQIERSDVTGDHRVKCLDKYTSIFEQRKYLKKCLAKIFHDLYNEYCEMHIFRQHKMYNNKNLNPQLYGEGNT